MTTQNLTLNDTLEEQLRLQLIEEKQTNDTLRAHITILEKAVKDEQNGKYNAPVKWNFQKYLIDREGRFIASFKPSKKVTDTKVLRMIRKQLNK